MSKTPLKKYFEKSAFKAHTAGHEERGNPPKDWTEMPSWKQWGYDGPIQSNDPSRSDVQNYNERMAQAQREYDKQ